MSAPESALPVTGGVASTIFAVVGLVVTGIGLLARYIARPVTT